MILHSSHFKVWEWLNHHLLFFQKVTIMSSALLTCLVPKVSMILMAKSSHSSHLKIWWMLNHYISFLKHYLKCKCKLSSAGSTSWKGGASFQMGNYPIPGQDSGVPPSQVRRGYPGLPPIQVRSQVSMGVPKPEHHSMYLLCGRRYASCIHAQGLSCFKLFQGSYRVLSKSTCAFLCFFSQLWLFFPVILWKVLFCAFYWQKCAFFLLNLLFFHKNTTFLKVLDTKRQNFLFYAHFFEKNFSLASLGIKFTLYIY